MKDAERGVLCDSLLQNRKEKIDLLEDKIEIQEQQKEALIELSKQQQEEIQSLRHDVERAKRKNKVLKIISGAAFVAVAVETVIILILK